MPWAAHDSDFALEFEEMTAWLAQRLDKTATRKLMGINWRTVGAIVERVVKARGEVQVLGGMGQALAALTYQPHVPAGLPPP